MFVFKNGYNFYEKSEKKKKKNYIFLFKYEYHLGLSRPLNNLI